MDSDNEFELRDPDTYSEDAMESSEEDEEPSDSESCGEKRKRKSKPDRHTMNRTKGKLVTFDHTDAGAAEFLGEETGKLLNAKWTVAKAEFHEDKDTHVHVYAGEREKTRWTQKQLEDLKCLIGGQDEYVEHVDISASWDCTAKSQLGGVKYVLKHFNEEVNGMQSDGFQYYVWTKDDEAKDDINGIISHILATKKGKWEQCVDLIHKGKDIDEISDAMPGFVAQNRPKIEREISVWEDRQADKKLYPFTLPDGTKVEAPPGRMEKRASFWFASGQTASVQKSTWIEDTFEGKAIFKKRDIRYPFDGYNGEAIIICDGKEKAPSFEEIETMTEWVKTKTHVYGSCRGTGSEKYIKKGQRVRYLVFTNDRPEYWNEPAFTERFARFDWDVQQKMWINAAPGRIVIKG